MSDSKLINEVGQIYEAAYIELQNEEDPDKRKQLALNYLQARDWYHGIIQFNDKLVWCRQCWKPHRKNTKVSWKHPTEPIPLKCSCDRDHRFQHIENLDHVSDRFKNSIIGVARRHEIEEHKMLEYTKPRTQVWVCWNCKKQELKEVIDMTPWFDEILEYYAQTKEEEQ